MGVLKALAQMLVWALGSVIILSPDDDTWAEYEKNGLP